MTVRKVVDGDITTSCAHFLYNKEDIEQTIRTRLSLWRGEYFRNVLDGTPWAERILGKGVSLHSREGAIKRRISQTPGVREIIAFSAGFDLATRTYSASCSVITDGGEVVQISYCGALNNQEIPDIPPSAIVSPSSSNIYAAASDGSGTLLIAGADGKLATSTDAGITWVLGTSGFGTDTINSSVFRDDFEGTAKWVTAGDAGKVFHSLDALSWTQSITNFGFNTVNSARGDANFGFYFSANSGNAGSGGDGTSVGTVDVAFGTTDVMDWINTSGGGRIAVGAEGTVSVSNSITNFIYVIRSVPFGTTTINSANWVFLSIGYTVIAGNEGKMAVSSGNLITWTAVNSTFGSSDINDMARQGFSLLLAVGNDGKMATSPDGSNWAAVADSSFGTTNIRGAVWDSNSSIWVAVGDEGKIATSPDTVAWTQQVSGF